MAHFAKVINNIVVDVIVIEPDDLNDYLENSLIHQMNPGQWIQTSYNTIGGVHYTKTGKSSADQSKALRGNFAGVGFHYDEELDAFYPPKPYASWVINKDTFTWEAPKTKPDGSYKWDEDSQEWKEFSDTLE